ncbi:DeoR family deoxyribose operon repressor [Thalassospira sp. MBR-102]|jgi:DeoR family deoxyribose operon repressor|uniref:DeoR/GlpR family DNA-binding transcription regulator n=1 Tax=Thalassospira TaxID=168934 RepID=UPI000A1E641B|nr:MULTISPECIES: DeoR/GlpR family DNA-binding transcription regulator [Thalassospira]MBR9779575.1 DeoR/GlpR transcriptional regulator [Rhodospirillales bacterium]MBR9818933.1 DeoR/GlpR transcriptional regulator [Rhodospirillales bacterium]OSQ29430.1 DeoR family transcriptional regulator [Thalassospira sp. MCCC 1A03138]RCK42263.1 DeoR family transcriptional regulator [Thalassospira xiamenensis]
MSIKSQDRIEALTRNLEVSNVIRLKDAADLLGVSEMTVRRDVANCENIFTYMGGYITLKSPAAGGLGYILDRERGSHTDLKRTACQIAARYVKPGDTIFLDCGTTIPYLANALPENRDITAICYSINVAEILCKKPGLRVIMLGGMYHASSASFADSNSVNAILNLNINTAFMSAGGVNISRGVSCSNPHEVDIKQAVLETAANKILVVDSTKFNVIKPMLFAKLEQFDMICTDPKCDPELATRTGCPLITQ